MKHHVSLRLGRLRAAMLALGIVAPVVLIGGAVTAQKKPDGKSPSSAQKFKNIRVLKTLPADQMIPVMHKISASLGVRCDFCHVVNADHKGFELDTKPEKETARKMIVMTQRLNNSEKILDGKATCFMCHHGRAMPEVKVPETPR